MQQGSEPKKRGRPCGDKRHVLCDMVKQHGRITMGQVVRSLGWSMRDADNTIRLALSRADIVCVGRVPQPGCKRPVAVYAVPSQPVQLLGSVVAGWVR